MGALLHEDPLPVGRFGPPFSVTLSPDLQVYQAKSWATPRRVVVKVEHYVGEPFPRVNTRPRHGTTSRRERPSHLHIHHGLP